MNRKRQTRHVPAEKKTQRRKLAMAIEHIGAMDIAIEDIEVLIEERKRMMQALDISQAQILSSAALCEQLSNALQMLMLTSAPDGPMQ